MILKEMVELYDRMIDAPNSQLPPFGWWRKKVTYRVRIGSSGEVVGILPYVVGEGKQQKDFIEMTVPYGERSSGVKPFFLCDNGGYLFGLDEKKGAEKFRASAELHKEVLGACTDAAAVALLRFFERGPQVDAFDQAQRTALSKAFIVFEYAPCNSYVHEVPGVIEAWDAYYSRLSASLEDGQCSIDGGFGPMARLYPQVTGVHGAQSAGASLVSFNFASSESYGMRGTENASISEKNSFKSGAVLRWLLKSNDHKMLVGDTTVVYWTDKAETDEVGLVARLIGFNKPASAPEDAKTLSGLTALLHAIRTGSNHFPGDLDTRFFVLGISPNNARLSVRFYYTQTLDNMIENLGRYLDDVSMDAVKPVSLARLLEQLLPPGKGSVLPSTLLSASYRALVTGSAFPQSLYVSLLERMKADHAKNHPWDMGQRAALFKACLVRKRRLKGDLREKELMMSLDQNNRNPGYVLGRLFAEIESAQIAALGKSINATVRDKYIASASTTPARVFPQLMAGCQNHLSKIGKTKPGFEVVLQKEIGQIIDLLSDQEGFFPKTLSVDDQGAFYIGYYQQRQANFAGKSNEADGVNQE